MFVIQKQNDRQYFSSKGKIILFNTPDEANYMLQLFQQYALQRLVSERGPQGVFELHEVLSQLLIIEQDFEDEPPCGVINFLELER